MTCTRAHEIDLVGFLDDASAREFASFRGHYPTCRTCSAEVRAWTELHARLGGSSHPEPGELLALEDGAPLAAELRARVEAHLAGCRSCREELVSLRGFRSAAVPLNPAARAARWLERLRGLLWHPAFAYAVALLLLVPLFGYRPPAELAQAGKDGVLEDAEQGRGQRLAANVEEQKRELAPARSVPGGSSQDRDEPAAPRASSPVPGLELERRASAGLRAKESATATVPPAPEASEPRVAEAAADRFAAARPDSRALAGSTLSVEVSPGRLLLRLPLPAGVGPGSTVTLRVHSGDGSRELSEQQQLPPDARELVMELPAGWLQPGRHQLEVARGRGSLATVVLVEPFDVPGTPARSPRLPRSLPH